MSMVFLIILFINFTGVFITDVQIVFTLDYNPVTNEKYCNPYSRTKKFTYRLERAGYKAIEKWECDFLKEKTMN